MAKMPRHQVLKQGVSLLEMLEAIIEVFDLVSAADEKAGAEGWHIYTGYFAVIYPRVAAAWSRRTGLDAETFPWTADYVKDAWVAIRKDSLGTLRHWVRESREGPAGPNLFADVA